MTGHAEGADGPGDGRYLAVGGRRWRASDPAIPQGLRSELVHELMAARRAVKAGAGQPGAVSSARRRVQDAKVALGERGAPWWEPATEAALRVRAAAAARALLRHRPEGATICPSEVARVVASPVWRDAMDLVRAVAADLAADGEVLVRQGGRVVDPAAARGPVRYGRGAAFPDPVADPVPETASPGRPTGEAPPGGSGPATGGRRRAGGGGERAGSAG